MWELWERRLTIFSTICTCSYPTSLGVNPPVLVSSRWASQKCILNTIPFFWIGGGQFQDLMDTQKISGLVKNIVCLGDSPWVWIGKFWHVPILERVFNLVENVVEWSYGIIINICYFFFGIDQMNWWYFSLRWDEVHNNLMYVSRAGVCPVAAYVRNPTRTGHCMVNDDTRSASGKEGQDN